MLGMTIEFKHNGIIKIGFQTTGAPKTIGSLILKIAGKTHTFPIAFKRFTLERIHIITNANMAAVAAGHVAQNINLMETCKECNRN